MQLILTTLVLISLTFSVQAQENLNPSIFLMSNIKHNYFGTGFQLKTKRGPVVVTNKHICQSNTIMFAILPNDEVKLLAVKKVSRKYDLCILSPIYGIPALTMAESYKPGDLAIVDGYPLAVRKVTLGIVGYYVLVDYSDDPIVGSEFSGLVNNGNSGSPVTSLGGKVIGVLNLKVSSMRIPGPGIFVPLELLKDFLDTSGY